MTMLLKLAETSVTDQHWSLRNHVVNQLREKINASESSCDA